MSLLSWFVSAGSRSPRWWCKVPVFAFFCSALWCAPTIALAQSGFSIEVAVADKSPAEQDAAYRIGMRSVLVQNSGDKTLLRRTDVREALNNAKLYVVQFNYRAPDAGAAIGADMPITDQVRRTGEATQIMKVRFDAERIRAVIKGQESAPQNANAPRAIANFRSALVWMYIQDNNQEVLIGAAKGLKVMQRSREIAGGNGIVLTFPAADDVDLQALGEAPIALEVDTILNASLRYNTPAIVTALIQRKRPVGWQSRWQLIVNDQVESSDFQADSLDELLRLGFAWTTPNQTSNAAAAQLALPATPLASEGTLWFSGVRSTADYASLLKWVTSVNGVQAAYAKELRGEDIVLAVQPRSALTGVQSALSQQANIRQIASPILADGTSPVVDAAYDLIR